MNAHGVVKKQSNIRRTRVNMKSKEILKEQSVLFQLAKASDAIRRKHRMLKSGHDITQQKMQNVFKPIIEPLEALVSYKKNLKREIKDEKVYIKKEEEEEEEEEDNQQQHLPQDDSVQNISLDKTMDKTFTSQEDIREDDEWSTGDDEKSHKDVDDLIYEYSTLLRNNKKTTLDVSYGVRKLAGDKLMIGDSPIHFKSDYIYVGDQKYPRNVGLVELLFKKTPKLEYLTPSDLANYEKIVITTNAHRKNYKSKSAIRQSKSHKFKTYISQMQHGVHKGGGYIPEYKVTGQDATYVHWDDPNELVDRLRILLASQAAGNSSHSNEIISIIEELREAKIIY